jgi:hypothetical protein
VVARQSDQDWWRARLSGNNREPCERAEERGRRGNCGKRRRRIGGPRRLLRQNAHRGLDVRAAGAWAEGAIAVVARRGAVAAVRAGTGAVNRAGNARLTRIEARGRNARARGGRVEDHGMRGNTRRVPVLRGHP